MTDSALAQTAGSTRNFSILLSVNALLVVVFQGQLQKWIKSIPFERTLLFGVFAIACGLFGFAVSGSSFPALLVSMCVFTAGEMMEFLSSNQILDQKAPAHLRGAYFGSQGLKYLGKFIGPPLFGICVETGMPSGVYWILGLSMIGFATLRSRVKAS